MMMMMMRMKRSLLRYNCSIITPRSPFVPCCFSTSIDPETLWLNYEMNYLPKRRSSDALVRFHDMLTMRPLPAISDFNDILLSDGNIGHSTTISLCGKLEMSRISPDVTTLNMLIDSFCNLNCVDFAFSTLGKLFKLGHQPSNTTFYALLEGLCYTGRVRDALYLVEDMEKTGYPHNITSFNIIINGFCYINPVHVGLTLVGGFLKLGHEPDWETFATLLKKLFDDGDIRNAVDLLIEMVKQGHRIEEFTLETLVNGLCKNDYATVALDILRIFVEKGFRPKIYVYNMVINSLCENCKYVTEALNLFFEMTAQDIVPDVVACTSLFCGLCELGYWDQAALVFDKLVQLNIYIAPSVKICTTLVDTIGKKMSDYDEARDVHEVMVQLGIKPNVVTYSTLIKGYCLQRSMDAALHLFRLMSEKGFEPNVDTYNTIIKGFLHSNDTPSALELVCEMGNRGISAHETTIQMFMEYLYHEKEDLYVSKKVYKLIETRDVPDENLNNEKMLQMITTMLRKL